jgi:hypothetical protein
MSSLPLRRFWIAAAALAACSSEGAVETAALEGLAQALVRAEPTEAFPQVVMVHVQRATNRTRCTGTAIAPRVVLTAAHCIQAGPLPGASYVYFGRADAPPSATRPEIPPPGEPSDFAVIESFLVHPDYDFNRAYPDLALVYLDRPVPFKPLPLLEPGCSHGVPAGDAWAGKTGTVIGWGGSKALTADITSVEGAGTKRGAQVQILGNPTAADFHADDPNLGMLEPEIRAASLKTEGRAPSANGCAGDSGGPLLFKTGGRSYVAAVAYWTGLFCEDYSIYTRVEPFLPFLHEAIERADHVPIVPRLECIDRGDDGTYTAFFGYQSDNGSSVEIPLGRRNALPQDRAEQRPHTFGPGEHPWAFSVNFKSKERLKYTLTPPGGPKTVLHVDRHAPRCECTAACDAALAAECNPGTFTRSDCVASCQEFSSLFVGCQAELNRYWQCISPLSPAASNWVCDPTALPQPAAPECQEAFLTAVGCAGFL